MYVLIFLVFVSIYSEIETFEFKQRKTSCWLALNSLLVNENERSRPWLWGQPSTNCAKQTIYQVERLEDLLAVAHRVLRRMFAAIAHNALRVIHSSSISNQNKWAEKPKLKYRPTKWRTWTKIEESISASAHVWTLFVINFSHFGQLPRKAWYCSFNFPTLLELFPVANSGWRSWTIHVFYIIVNIRK